MAGLNKEAVLALLKHGFTEDAQMGMSVHAMNQLTIELQALKSYASSDQASTCGGMSDYVISGQVFGFFSRWFGLLDITTNIIHTLDESVHPDGSYLYWHNAQLDQYPDLYAAQQAMASLELRVSDNQHTDGKTIFNAIHHNRMVVVIPAWADKMRRLKLRYANLSHDLIPDILVPLHAATAAWVSAVRKVYLVAKPEAQIPEVQT